jgi:hypothetical protein
MVKFWSMANRTDIASCHWYWLLISFASSNCHGLLTLKHACWSFSWFRGTLTSYQITERQEIIEMRLHAKRSNQIFKSRTWTYSKSNHGNTSHEELILLSETDATRGTKNAIFNLWLRWWSSLISELKKTHTIKSNFIYLFF